MFVSFLCSILKWWDLKLLFVVIVISSQGYFLLSHIVWYLFQSHIAWYFFHNVWIIQWYDISCNPTKPDISCSLICLQQPDGCQLVQYLLTAPQPSGSQKGKKMISFGCLGKYVSKLLHTFFVLCIICCVLCILYLYVDKPAWCTSQTSNERSTSSTHHTVPA